MSVGTSGNRKIVFSCVPGGFLIGLTVHPPAYHLDTVKVVDGPGGEGLIIDTFQDAPVDAEIPERVGRDLQTVIVLRRFEDLLNR